MEGKINILCVSTFDADEPYLEVLKAARELPDNYVIYMTGDYGKMDSALSDKCPKQIRLTGFLTEDDYWSLLSSVDLVMDLTSRENCLVCGAYEAVSQRKPLVLSDTPMLQEYFKKGAVFTKNNSKDIQQVIVKAVKNIEMLRHEVKEGYLILEKQWLEDGQKLVQILQDYSHV